MDRNLIFPLRHTSSFRLRLDAISMNLLERSSLVG
jgi:hypothetical protein